MKRRVFLLAAALALLLFCGCTPRGGTAESRPEEPASSAAGEPGPSEEPEPPEEGPEADDGGEQAAALAGKYMFHAKGVEEVYCPTLTLREDGTYRFQVNLLSGMGDINGSFTVEDDALLTLHVETLSFDGFLGDDTKRIYFEVASDSGLLYRGTDAGEEAVIGLTNPMDLFKKEEKKA